MSQCSPKTRSVLLLPAVDRICFPADALVRRLTPTGGVSLVRIDQVALGDKIECLKPTMTNDGLVTSFAADFCDVYYYISTRHVGY
jgi:hypothetical protein